MNKIILYAIISILLLSVVYGLAYPIATLSCYNVTRIKIFNHNNVSYSVQLSNEGFAIMCHDDGDDIWSCVCNANRTSSYILLTDKAGSFDFTTEYYINPTVADLVTTPPVPPTLDEELLNKRTYKSNVATTEQKPTIFPTLTGDNLGGIGTAITIAIVGVGFIMVVVVLLIWRYIYKEKKKKSPDKIDSDIKKIMENLK